MIFKKIRDLLISSLVLEIVAIILGIASFYKIKEAFTNSTNMVQNVVESFMSDYIALGLLGGFVLLSFIAFFLLPIIAACQYGSKLDVGYKPLKNICILSTPASLVFLPLVVLLWPIMVLVGIGKSDSLYRRHKEIKNPNKNDKDGKKETKTNIVDLTTPALETTPNNVNPAPQTVNGPVGIARPTRPASGVYVPGQASRPTTNTVYIRNPNGVQRRI